MKIFEISVIISSLSDNKEYTMNQTVNDLKQKFEEKKKSISQDAKEVGLVAGIETAGAVAEVAFYEVMWRTIANGASTVVDTASSVGNSAVEVAGSAYDTVGSVGSSAVDTISTLGTSAVDVATVMGSGAIDVACAVGSGAVDVTCAVASGVGEVIGAVLE